MRWDAVLYDKKHSFVAEYGKELLQYIPEKSQQRILDLGCGTGVLTAQLANLCSYILGVDSSQDMIQKASSHYKEIDFRVCNALELPFENEWDIVFSNAVFHWINDHNRLLQNIYQVLKPKGLLICEFGAHGNIAKMEHAFASILAEAGYDYHPKFTFPKVEEFGELLTANHFLIDTLYDYDSSRPLKDGEKGLANWIRQFFADELAFVPEEEQDIIFHKTEELLKPVLWNGKEWIADYRRLRAVAHIN